MIHSFVVDAALEHDARHEGIHCPPQCGLCREACPTGAIVADLRLDPRKCIAHNTFVTRGEDSGVSPGVTEARRGAEQFGERRLVDVVSNLRGRVAQEVAEGVRDAALSFADSLRDDLHVVCLRLA